MKLFGCKFAILLSCLVLAATTTADAQKLRYKFKKGQKLHYEMSQNMKMLMSVAGQEVEMDMKQKMNTELVVKNVDAKGVASIESKVTRLRMDVAMEVAGQNQSFEYDSDKKEEPDNLMAQMMIKGMKPIVGSSSTMKMDALGKIVEYKLSEEAKKALKDAAPQQQGFGGGRLNEESMKSMAEQSGMVFPEGDLAKGKSWKNNTNVSVQFGKMKMETTLKFLGTETIDGKKMAKISVTPKLKMEAKQDSPIPFELKSSEGKGTFYFDIENGRIHKSVLNQTMLMEADFMGQTAEADLDLEVTMKLVEKKK